MPKASVRVPHLHTEYDPPFDAGIDCSVEPSMTIQSAAAECDINNIMKRYELTGLIDVTSNQNGLFADVASAVDYHTAQTLIAQAQEVFNELPVKVRRRFSEDPGQLLAFLDNPENRDEAIALGLIDAPKAAVAAAAGSSSSPLAAAAPAAAASGEPSKGDLKGA